MAHMKKCQICGEDVCDVDVCNKCCDVAGKLALKDPDLKKEVLKKRSIEPTPGIGDKVNMVGLMDKSGPRIG